MTEDMEQSSSTNVSATKTMMKNADTTVKKIKNDHKCNQKTQTIHTSVTKKP